MTEAEQYQAKLKEIYLLEEARSTALRLYHQGFLMGAGGSSTTENLYVESDYCDDYFE
jgi:hypothetical protein